MDMNLKIRTIQIVNLIVSAAGLIFFYEPSYLIYSLIAWFIFFHINVGVTLHRLLSHKSFKVNELSESILSLLTVLSTLGPTLSWVSMHRFHHKHADSDKDPHSPISNNKLSLRKSVKTILGIGWNIKESVDIKIVRDLLRGSIHKFIFSHYFKILALYVIMLMLLDPILVIYLYTLPATLTIAFLGITNVLSHSSGYRNYETSDHSTNNILISIITLGDGWHNNHHAFPNRYYMTSKWYEIDILGAIIWMIRKRES